MRITTIVALALASVVALSTYTWSIHYPAAPPNVVLAERVPFCVGRVGTRDEVLYLDLARPKGQTKALPVVLLVHGGGWAGGSRGDFRHLLLALAQHNRVAISVDYRVTPESQFPAQLEDVKCAVRWIREHAAAYQFDTRRLVAVGGSAGAHLVALLGTTAGIPEYEGRGGFPTQPSHIDAMVLHGGVYDLHHRVTETLPSLGSEHSNGIKAVEALLGGTVTDRREAYIRASPASHVTQATAPTLLLHGMSDPLVPYAEAVRFDQTLRAHGVISELILIDGAGHGDFGPNPDPITKRFLAFISGPNTQ